MRQWQDGADWHMVHAGLRLSLAPDGRFRTAVQGEDDAWRPAAALPNTLVSGINLAPATLSGNDAGLHLQGSGPIPGSEWQGSVTAAGDLLRFSVRLQLPEPLPARPELLLWLGPLSVMDDRQRLTWRRTLLAGPTANGQGLPGNDLPALYHWDPRQQVETVLAVDAGAMRWAPGRLLNYRCGERWDYAGERYGVGLMATGEPYRLAAGEHRFVWYLGQRWRPMQPGQGEGAVSLVALLAPLLPPAPAYPGAGATWTQLAAGCRSDLAQRDLCGAEYDGSRGLRAYVRGTSRYFTDADQRQGFELMALIDVLPPLLLYNRLHPSPAGAALQADLLATLPRFRPPSVPLLLNDVPQRSTVADLWYPFENSLIKLGWVVALTGDAALRKLLSESLDTAAGLARHFGYLFPLFADVAAPAAVGGASNYSVGGLYAYAQAQAYHLLGGEVHRQEAEAALAVLRRVPLELWYHEPQQLGFAAAAAAWLQRPDWAGEFLAAQLRMAYWFDDPGAGQARVPGMFQACASLLYPAFKENVESLLPWTVLLQHGVGDPGLLLRFLALQRANNRDFFGAGPCPHVPFENLGSSELPQAGSIGKEIYGAGEVFWLYLLLEGTRQCDDPAVLAVSLDLLHPATLAAFPSGCREYMLYNTAADRRRGRFGGSVRYDLVPGAWQPVSF